MRDQDSTFLLFWKSCLLILPQRRKPSNCTNCAGRHLSIYKLCAAHVRAQKSIIHAQFHQPTNEHISHTMMTLTNNTRWVKDNSWYISVVCLRTYNTERGFSFGSRLSYYFYSPINVIQPYKSTTPPPTVHQQNPNILTQINTQQKIHHKL